MNGWIILDKPSGITSAHAVAKVKRLLKPQKIGHAGTLDPLASGILPLALGEATKTVAYMMDASKAYAFTVHWGEERDTDDSMGQVTQTSGNRPSASDINSILPSFTGTISQLPPNYSALKVDGKRAYELARGGEIPELKARQVRVDSLICERADEGSADFVCHCGKGTYIRSLARDMGRILGSYGHITRLRRLKVGKFTEKEAISLEVLQEMVHKGELGFLQSVEAALDDILARNMDENQAARLRRGQTVTLSPDYAEEPAGAIVLARHNDRPVAICEMSQNTIKPIRVFNL